MMMKTKKINLFIILLSITLCMSTLCFAVSASSTSGETTTPTIQIVNGASVRNTKENAGIRFSGLVNVNCFNTGTTTLKDGYEAGMLIIDKDGYDTAGKLDHTVDKNTYKIQDIKAETWHTTSQYTNENQIAFNAVIKVPETAYASTLMLTARAYVYDGTEYFYSDTVTRCMAQVSSHALALGWDDSFGALTKHVDNANGDFTVNGQSDEFIDITLKVGESISPVVLPEYLTVALSSDDEGVVSVKDGKITAIAMSETPVSVTATLGSLTKTINVAVDSSDVDAELLGAYYTNVDNLFGRVEAGYTCDTEKLSSGASVGLHFKASDWVAKPNGEVSEPAYIYLKTDANLKANTTYTLRYKVTKVAQTSGPDFGWNVCVGRTKDSYKALNDAVSDLGSIGNTYARRLTFTTTTAVEGMNFVVIIAPNAFTDIEFTMTDISIVEGDDYFSSVSTSTITTKVYADENNKPIFNMKGASNVPKNSAVNIATNVNLEANKEYVLTYKFNIVNAVKATTNIHWGINFYNSADNFNSLVQFNVASKLGEASANTYVGASCVDKATVLSFDLAPTQDVTNFIFRVYIHGTYMSEFEFEVSDIFVIEKSALSNDLMGATLNSSATNATLMQRYNITANYVTDKDLLVTGNDYGILVDKKVDTNNKGDNSYGATYKLNAGMTAGTNYDITFKVIGLNLKMSTKGKPAFVAFGLTGEKLGGAENSCGLGVLMDNEFVTTETIGGYVVYTITISNYQALNTVDNVQFNAFIRSTASTPVKEAQSYIVTGISITESATAN